MVVYSVIEDFQQILVDISWQLATHQIKIRKPTYFYHNWYYVIVVYSPVIYVRNNLYINI